MRKQQKVWQQEHNSVDTLPAMAHSEPSSGVKAFLYYLNRRDIKPPLEAVDIGSGKGRNAIYLAQCGFDVYAMDYIKQALKIVKEKAKEDGVSKRVHAIEAEIDKRWPFADNFFDIAIDSFSSIDIETRKGRLIYKKEMYRTLKPGGYALVMVVSAEDEWEKKLIATNPGKEKNSTFWPQNGKFQKDYDEKELREFYKQFTIIKLKEIKKKAFKLGKEYTATNYWVLLQK